MARKKKHKSHDQMKNADVSEPSIDRQQQKHAGNNEQQVPQQQQREPPAVNSSITQPSAEDKQWREKQEGYWKSQICISKWLNGITVAGFVIALVGLSFVYQQASTARISADAAVKQVNLAEATLKMAERSWITISEAGFILKSKNDPGEVFIILKNTGRSPALRTHALYSAVFTDVLPEGPMPAHPLTGKQSEAVIGPGATVRMARAPQLIKGATGGKIFTYGSIEYEDRITENIRHRTSFCFELQAIASNLKVHPLSPCANDWNDAS